MFLSDRRRLSLSNADRAPLKLDHLKLNRRPVGFWHVVFDIEIYNHSEHLLELILHIGDVKQRNQTGLALWNGR